MGKKRDAKYWRRKFGAFGESIEPYYHQFDLRAFDDLDDESFAYLLSKVRGVYMLDLNEIGITDESIKLLAQLEYVTELRAKGINGLTNACAEDLNKIKGLEYLHVKSTDITIDGLLKLKDQHNMRTILFSADDVDAIKDKMIQLREMHPNCEFIIDGKVYEFEEENDWNNYPI